MCEISHQSVLNVGVVGNMAQDFGSLVGSFGIGIAVVQIPARDTSQQSYSSEQIFEKNTTNS